MRRWRIIGSLLLIVVLAGTIACGSGEETATQQQLIEVVRGELILNVNGTGNIEASRQVKLTFGAAGKVDKIYVEKGDTVSEGDLLTKLDTHALELAKSQSQVAVNQAEIAVIQAELAQQTAERALTTIKDTEDSLKLALLTAQINLDQANYNLNKTQDLYTWTDIKIAQADVDESSDYLEYSIEKLYEYLPIILDEDGIEVYPAIEDDFVKPPGYKVWQDRIIHAQARLNSAKDRLEALQSGRDTAETAIKRKQLAAAEMTEAQAEKNLNNLAADIALQELQAAAAKESVSQARRSAELAELTLSEAARQLDEATITAPFSGIIVGVGAEEAEFVTAANTIIQLINNSMELILEIDEIDIPGVEVGQEVIIEIDALPAVLFPGTVDVIYPMPNAVGGIILYEVKINLSDKEGSGIKIGMSASADIITHQRSNVLLVPSRAIKQDDQGKPLVKVMVNGQTQERLIIIGISDDSQTEIISGLNEGETVVVERRAR